MAAEGMGASTQAWIVQHPILVPWAKWGLGSVTAEQDRHVDCAGASCRFDWPQRRQDWMPGSSAGSSLAHAARQPPALHMLHKLKTFQQASAHTAVHIHRAGIQGLCRATCKRHNG